MFYAAMQHVHRDTRHLTPKASRPVVHAVTLDVVKNSVENFNMRPCLAAAESDGAFLLGADGEHLVYRVGYGNVRLFWVRPGLQ